MHYILLFAAVAGGGLFGLMAGVHIGLQKGKLREPIERGLPAASPPPFKKEGAKSVVPSVAPIARPLLRPQSIRIELLIGADAIPLVYSQELPVSELVTAPATVMDTGDLAGYDRGVEMPVDPLPPFSVRDVEELGVIMVGRGGNIRPQLLQGFGAMPRIMFEIGVKDDVFRITAKRAMQDSIIQISVGEDSKKFFLTTSSPPMTLRSRVDVRLVVPGKKEQQVSAWRFRISLLS